MKETSLQVVALFGAGLVALGILGFLLVERSNLKEQIGGLQHRLANEEERAQGLAHTLMIREEEIASLIRDREELADELEDEKDRVREIEEQVGDAIKTVGVLDKLAKTDSELLQKYSKVYFLNEHYAPPRVARIKKEHLYHETNEQYLHAQVMPFFEHMMEEAAEDGIELFVASAYRSFDQQTSLKSAYKVTYGSGANAFSADQGYSEHQLGTAIDFTTTGINGGLDGFEQTEAYAWLTKNAHRFGFALSYPPNNAYYIFEPWHWRFVGEDLARELKNEGKYFYDLDQREIDKYLVSLFD